MQPETSLNELHFEKKQKILTIQSSFVALFFVYLAELPFFLALKII